jgi:glycosyltransferase involved in cell wall biosynthesis
MTIMPADNNSNLWAEDQLPLNVFFVITSMPVGGAEVLLCNLIRCMDRNRFTPHLVCLKELGELGTQLATEVPNWHSLLRSKWDISILPRLTTVFREHRATAVITVGAGDKMFWGRLAAKQAKVPVICSALHSTGWPDGVGKLNRLLTRWTDAFIAVAKAHGEFLSSFERFPANKVHVIPNGVDTQVFQPNTSMRRLIRRQLQIPESSPLVGIVAALRPEKNHGLLVRSAVRVLTEHPECHFLIIGDGPERSHIEQLIADLGLQHRFHLLGNRHDTPHLLAALDVFALCSLNEANPVSILEALSTGIPVVSTDVGSIHETVLNAQNGFLVPSEDAVAFAARICELLRSPQQASKLGRNGRAHILGGWSLDAMVSGYENLIEQIYWQKQSRTPPARNNIPSADTTSTKSVSTDAQAVVLPSLPISPTNLQQHA